MPFAAINGNRAFYRLEGRKGAPVLVLAHSIGCDHGMWAAQMPQFTAHYKVLRYDLRGHGASDVPAGDYSVEQLARDAVALPRHLEITEFAFCGLSLGGAIGQWLAINHAPGLTALILANTSPRFLPADAWETRRRTALEKGMAAIADGAIPRMFSPETLAGAEGALSDGAVDSIRSVLAATSPVGYAGCCAALRDMDHTTLLSKIRVPTLLISGTSDVATPWSGHGELLARGIAGARVVHLPASHLSNLERPRSFAAAVLNLLRTQLPAEFPGEDTQTAGDRMRRAVLGDDHVNQAAAQSTEFTREFQSFIRRYAWGEVWSRPGLLPRTRRLLTLAMLAALGRWEEFRTHVRAGLARDLEPCDLEEVLLQVAIYVGIPAANTAFHIAGEEIKSSIWAHAGAAGQDPK